MKESPGWGSLPSSSASSARRRLRATLLLLAGVAASVWGFSDAASAAPAAASAAPASRPSRSVSAPADVLTLVDYVMQPPGEPEPGEGGEEDEPTEPREPKEPSTDQPTPLPPPAPKFDVSDTLIQRSDSVRSSPFDSTGTVIRPISAAPGPAATATPGVKPRRGILGLHPLALLVGLIALHVFVVTAAGK
ncbi:MAG TPA: hypothetical protein VGJ98_01205 [Candidatus Eisenbacteria bacterium]